MGYIKEPKGVDFVVEPHVLTDEDQKIMSKIIADYKATGFKPPYFNSFSRSLLFGWPFPAVIRLYKLS